MACYGRCPSAGSIPGENVDAASIGDIARRERRSQRKRSGQWVSSPSMARWIAGTRPGPTAAAASPPSLVQQARDSRGNHRSGAGRARRLYGVNPADRARRQCRRLPFAASEIGADFVAALARLAPVEVSVYAAVIRRAACCSPLRAARKASETMVRPLFADEATAGNRWAPLIVSGDGRATNWLLGLGAVVFLALDDC